MAIYNALKRHKASVTVYVDGVAASAASFIAMAGDKIIMPANAFMFIHNPIGGAYGNADDMREMADALEKMELSTAGIYSTRTGMDIEEVRKMMDDETWLTATEAKEKGFADEIEAEKKIAASFDLAKRYGMVPEALLSRQPAGEPKSKEKSMTKVKQTAGDPPADDPKDPPVGDPPPASDPPVGDPPADPPADNPPADPSQSRQAEFAEIAKLCADGGVPAMAAKLIADGVSLADAKQRIGSASTIRGMFAKAKKMNSAVDMAQCDAMIATGSSVDMVKAHLFDTLAATQSSPTKNRSVPNDGTEPSSNGWDKAVTKINARNK